MKYRSRLQKAQVRVPCVPVKIQTKHILITSLQNYYYTSLLSLVQEVNLRFYCLHEQTKNYIFK